MRLALFDRCGMDRMDATPRGVWFSFLAPLAMLPIMLWFPQFVDKDSAVTADNDSLWWVKQVLAYFAALLAFPVAMYYVTRAMGLRDKFLPMIAAMNWAAVWQTLLVLGGYFLYLTDAVPFAVGNVALFITSGFTMVYLTYVMQVSLGVKNIVAFGFVILMAAIQMVSYALTQIPA